jgi:hypothetical protein
MTEGPSHVRLTFKPAVVGTALLAVLLPLTTHTAAAAVRMPGATQHYTVWRGGERSLPNHTILRPAKLAAVPYRLPVVVWGNGGCRPSNEEYHYFLTTLASHGVFVIANGNPGVAYDALDWTGLVKPQPQLLTQAIDWAVKQDADPHSRYYRKLDPRRIAVMGQSCGGWEATDASNDPRVRSSIIWNSGANPYHPSGALDLHAPTLFAWGGPVDHVAAETIASYQATDAPAVLISNSDGGHTNWWDSPTDGSPTPTPAQREPVMVTDQWLAFTLYGSKAGRQFFLGPSCGLCRQPGWTVSSKNWEG